MPVHHTRRVYADSTYELDRKARVWNWKDARRRRYGPANNGGRDLVSVQCSTDCVPMFFEGPNGVRPANVYEYRDGHRMIDEACLACGQTIREA